MAVAKQCIVCALLYPILSPQADCLHRTAVCVGPPLRHRDWCGNQDIPSTIHGGHRYTCCLIGAAPYPLSPITSNQLLQGLPLHIQPVAVVHLTARPFRSFS